MHTWVFLSAILQRKKKEKEKPEWEGEGGEGRVYLGGTGSTKHSTTGGQDLSLRKAMCGASDLLSYCAHSSESLRTPNNKYIITYSQKLDWSQFYRWRLGFLKKLLQEHRNRLLLFPMEKYKRGKENRKYLSFYLYIVFFMLKKMCFFKC